MKNTIAWHVRSKLQIWVLMDYHNVFGNLVGARIVGGTRVLTFELPFSI